MGKTKSRANGDGDVWPRKNKAGKITSYRGAYVESIVRVHIKPSIGRVKLEALTPNHVRGLYRQKLDAGLALHCGLREGELLGLRWDDVDLTRTTATIQVRRTLSETRTGHKFEKPKNGKGRSIRCSQKATEALRSHRTRQNKERGLG
jgi:integrase